MAIYHWISWIRILIPAFISVILVSSNQTETWDSCETFFAPSSLPSGGWGIYAGRDFRATEIVEISPRFIALQHEIPTVHNSVLDDYVYGYSRRNQETNEFDRLVCIVFGNAMFYNHHREPNVAWTSFGREPTDEEPNIGIATGFIARRDIATGEELFASYGTDDGGTRWFQQRKLELVLVPTYLSRKNGTTYDEDKKKYCSKIHSGLGQPTWISRILNIVYSDLFIFNISRLPMDDHATAVAKQAVLVGETLEMSPALIIDKKMVSNTPLAPSCFFWDDWDSTQQQALREFRSSSDLRLQYQGYDTEWVRIDAFQRFEDVAVIPVPGNIGLINRVGKSMEANCEIKIVSSGSMKSHLDHGGSNGNAGIILQVVALKEIAVGEELKLNIPRVTNFEENSLLVQELLRSGQIVPSYLENLGNEVDSNDEL
jgi:hypothetical protein